MCAQVPAAMAFGGEVVLVYDLNRIPVPPGDRMPVRARTGSMRVTASLVQAGMERTSCWRQREVSILPRGCRDWLKHA
jgi:hypothetical protein